MSVHSNGRQAVVPDSNLRLAAEDFLYHEAALLDEWKLDEWLQLFTEDARYVVPTTDLPDGDPERDLVFVDDDIVRLRGRVVRLNSRHAHREYPSSRTRRLITNVRVVDATERELRIEASFAVYRSRSGQIAPYVGQYKYTLVRTSEGGFLIRYRRANLDIEILREHGAVSIIL